MSKTHSINLKIISIGLGTGLLLQLAIGPVFFFITNLTLQKTIWDGFAGVAAVTLVDYLYITLAILGIGKLLEKKKIKKVFGIISSIVLILFGAMTIREIAEVTYSFASYSSSMDLSKSFSSVFLLTISSPMGIIFWTSLFATRVVESNYSKRELFIFGLSTGLATLLFMGMSVIIFSLIKSSVPILLIQFLNVLVGFLLIGYGSVRLIKVLRS